MLKRQPPAFERGLVKQPGGLLRALIERHQNGTLHLDLSLYGLAEAIAAQVGHWPRCPETDILLPPIVDILRILKAAEKCRKTGVVAYFPALSRRKQSGVFFEPASNA